MENLTLKVVDFYGGKFIFEKTLLYKFLTTKYNLIESENPSLVIYSVFGDEHLKYKDSTRLFFAGENIFPDFNSDDFSLSYERDNLNSRNMYCPFHHMYNFEMMEALSQKSFYAWDNNLLNRDFCNFIYSNNQVPFRDTFFYELSKYKKVLSGGKHLNNINKQIDNKFDFQNKTKFSICFENSIYPGYTTEKIVDALYARTVPIYFGDPLILEEFNKNAIINVRDYKNIKDLIDYIIFLDENDAAYKEKLETMALNRTFEEFSYNNSLKIFMDNVITGENIGKNRRLSSIWIQTHETRKTMNLNYHKRRETNILYRCFDNFFRKLYKEI